MRSHISIISTLPSLVLLTLVRLGLCENEQRNFVSRIDYRCDYSHHCRHLRLCKPSDESGVLNCFDTTPLLTEHLGVSDLSDFLICGAVGSCEGGEGDVLLTGSRSSDLHALVGDYYDSHTEQNEHKAEGHELPVNLDEVTEPSQNGISDTLGVNVVEDTTKESQDHAEVKAQPPTQSHNKVFDFIHLQSWMDPSRWWVLYLRLGKILRSMNPLPFLQWARVTFAPKFQEILTATRKLFSASYIASVWHQFPTITSLVTSSDIQEKTQARSISSEKSTDLACGQMLEHLVSGSGVEWMIRVTMWSTNSQCDMLGVMGLVSKEGLVNIGGLDVVGEDLFRYTHVSEYWYADVVYSRVGN